MRHLQFVGVGQVDRVQRLAVDVELELGGRAVANPDWARSPVALEVIESELLQVRRPVDPVHDLQGCGSLGRVAYPVVQPLQECRRLGREAEAEKGVDRERRIPDPGEPVVPVSFPADLFW
jgi:hypothetical protein